MIEVIKTHEQYLNQDPELVNGSDVMLGGMVYDLPIVKGAVNQLIDNDPNLDENDVINLDIADQSISLTRGQWKKLREILAI